MANIMTIIEAHVNEDDWPTLRSRWREISGRRPESILRSWLIQGLDGGETWCVVALWTSREALEQYRSSVDVPEVYSMFRAVNAEPGMAAFEVVAEG